MLNTLQPTPMGVLYLYCRYYTGRGSWPVLQFGNGNQAADLITQREIGIRAMDDRPLVFANACATSGTGAYVPNDLEALFFERGSRAYIGTEIKVPPVLASRLAMIFFHYFYRKLDSRPIAVGEALAQSRLFLWQHYKNIGGLFYTCMDQYELFLADDDEISRLRA